MKTFLKMPLIKANAMLDKLSQTDSFFKDPAISCWAKKQGKISIYSFAMVFATAEELQANYKAMRDHVAISFQSQVLESSAERWNLYLFYIVQEKMAHGLKQEIEHDKFSTRKIVCANVEGIIDEVRIQALIEAELFDFPITQRPVSTGTLRGLLDSAHPAVGQVLSKFADADKTASLEDLLNLLGHE
ncbi:ABC-three component system middle component 1 [Mucilaginibacter pocheonensis]|uniref:Uncharacterized protein n=1 Tax=Mucilaginibacter pocheonensis TaxID=398050 RepID=A0ABU1TEH5_9SPHI|nr:ABC-three component system middle component 1 [Mucilaginibacter pocheonensis]MDR6943646.1 hypothetical protein [Mucilaginibacter pocheonensis]